MGDISGNLMKGAIIGLAAAGVNWAIVSYMPQFAIGGWIGQVLVVAVGFTVAKEVKAA